MKKKKILIRADTSSKIGLGHIFRSLGLFQILKLKFDVTFITKSLNFVFKNLINDKGVNIKVIENESDFYKFITLDHIVVLDGYHFDYNFQKTIKPKCFKLICIDDHKDVKYFCDYVINHGPTFSVDDFKTNCSDIVFFLGLKYLLLRKEFLKISENKICLKSYQNKNDVFVCFGGTDQHELVQKTVNILNKYNFNYIRLLVGKNSIKLNFNNNSKVKVYHSLGPNEIIDQVRKCKLAIVPSSTIMLELFTIGIPIISGSFVDNQVESLS